MEVDNDFADSLLNDPRNYRNQSAAIKPDPSLPSPTLVNDYAGKAGGHGNAGKPRYTEEEKVLAGVLAHSFPVRDVAEVTGMSATTVQDVKRGNISNRRHDPELKDKIDDAIEEEAKTKQSVRDLALDRITALFADQLNEENLATIRKPREAAAVARDLATIAERVTVKAPGQGVTVIFHTPRQKSEDEYQAVDIEHTPTARRVD